MRKIKNKLERANSAKDKHDATSQNECLNEKNETHFLVYGLKNLLHNVFFKISLLIIAAAFIFIGILRGEHTIVLQKAIRICMECIGLG